ncbi:MAG TPA: DNA mismatch repair endonuclease MutL [Candidatus Polarisedimenticolia bacterium]|nr:DNA mismatch repair endonuclease MutL [Candidatus Polarisedimenticolia bacterium]
MGSIRVLEANVANQIAAGEVVERPASVVKELLENSLDAGAARVEIAVVGGGAELIRVADDGAGMERDDAQLAFERHATSKIRGATDLRAIHTYGFRGEALPSIASVSGVTLTTSTGGVTGTRVRLRSGKVLGVEPAPHPRGTTVEVEGLFHNAPARRKFLRSAATETGHIAMIVTRVAAAHPGIAFVLQSGGRDLSRLPPAADYRERVAQIVGRDDARSLVPIERRAGGLRVVGLASEPALHRSTSADEHLFVNGRPIRDRRILHAVQAAYATLLPRGRYPVVYLFLEMPPEEVDVNVHPAKAEVRFLHPAAVHDLVRQALLEGMGVSRPFYRLGTPAPGVAEPDPARPSVAPHPVSGPRPPGAGGDPIEVIGSTGRSSIPPRVDEPARQAASAALFDAVSLAPLAQFRDSYILAAAPDGLVIVDQHAAHERVLYERLMAQSRDGRIAVQRLLFPVTVEVPPAERQAFEGARQDLAEFGFSVAPFGENTLVVDAIPALVPAGTAARLLRELLGEILEWRRAEGVERLRHRLVATAACHAAVTANHPLDTPRMRAIVADLLGTDMPMTCPHGRPVLLRLTLDEIEREFHRK